MWKGMCPRRAERGGSSLARWVKELEWLVWWWLNARMDGERWTVRLIVSPHATRRNREVVVVHGEVSRSGEDLTSTARQTVVPD